MVALANECSLFHFLSFYAHPLNLLDISQMSVPTSVLMFSFANITYLHTFSHYLHENDPQIC